ncbi:MAG: hypothetical protein HC895_11085, partial [Leptolyngbyaceae cyanobacterium SM1_3_5]|nr:hypothetical protein [Leptolyngbyaceae cyanobacterium SM1_3_5]
MNTSRWIGSIGLGLAIASCGQPAAEQSTPTRAVIVSPSVAVSPAASPAAQSPAGSIAVPPAPSVLPVPNLIPPTSAESRVSQINTGRSNPHANVATTPRVTVSPAASPRASVPTVAVQPAAARSTPASAPTPTVSRSNPQSNSNPAAVRPAANPSQPQAVLPTTARL